jgi:hypothetical protein
MPDYCKISCFVDLIDSDCKEGRCFACPKSIEDTNILFDRRGTSIIVQVGLMSPSRAAKLDHRIRHGCVSSRNDTNRIWLCQLRPVLYRKYGTSVALHKSNASNRKLTHHLYMGTLPTLRNPGATEHSRRETDFHKAATITAATE